MRKNYTLNKEISPIEYTRFEGKAFYNHGELNIVFSAFDEAGNQKSFVRRLYKKHDVRLSPMTFTFQNVEYEVRWKTDPEESSKVVRIDE